MDNDFHKHLDQCERCRNQPFNLCAEGAEKLKRAALEMASGVKPPAWNAPANARPAPADTTSSATNTRTEK